MAEFALRVNTSLVLQSWEAPAGPNIGLYLIGDSLYGPAGSPGQPTTPELVRDMMPAGQEPTRYEAYSYPGETAAQVLAHARQTIFANPPTVGTNVLGSSLGINTIGYDVINGVDADTSINNLQATIRTFFSEARAAGFLPFASTYTFPVNRNVTLTEAQVKELLTRVARMNRWLRVEAQNELNAAALADRAADDRLNSRVAGANTAIFFDGIHLTLAGKQVEAPIILGAVLAALAGTYAVISGNRPFPYPFTGPSAPVTGSINIESSDFDLGPGWQDTRNLPDGGASIAFGYPSDGFGNYTNINNERAELLCETRYADLLCVTQPNGGTQLLRIVRVTDDEVIEETIYDQNGNVQPAGAGANIPQARVDGGYFDLYKVRADSAQASGGNGVGFDGVILSRQP